MIADEVDPAGHPARAEAGVTKTGVTKADVSKTWLNALAAIAPISAAPLRTFPAVIQELAERLADAPALLCDTETLSFRALDERANRYARWAIAQNLGRGQAVCLMMPNRPEYMAIWIGIIRAGATAALINTNLAGPALAHAIDIVEAAHIIVADALADALESARPYLKTRPRVWSHGPSPHPDISDYVAGTSGAGLAGDERRVVSIDDRALYVYTSGTTGLPKAAKISHYRLMVWTHWFAGMMGTGPADRMYNCLPMYHSIGGAVATGAVLVNGGAVAIREKFSASAFWSDVVRFDCTLFQYIGELCRYLVQAPADPMETRHRLRLACGNGLRADVWEAFRERFRIPQILEFYAATEANVSLFNVEGRPGAIGRIPPFIAHRTSLALVKFDRERGAPLRDAQGFCVRCAPDETGEAIGRISADPADRGSRFDGYTDEAATENKILRNVFEPGDGWFRTGDLMRRDRSGFFYFVDRVGDTFRWKGENVATTEVAAAIADFPGITDANVYGVAIPNAEGRAGMAEIVCAGSLDLVAFHDHLARRLPRYAHPVFLRMRRTIDATTTFKPIKHAPEGYDPVACPDPLFVLHPERRAYVRLDRALYEAIAGGGVRL
jgi:fatty-acyl-CoA synthase